MEDNEAEVMKELEKALLESGYSEKVKDAVIDWYTKHAF